MRSEGYSSSLFVVMCRPWFSLSLSILYDLMFTVKSSVYDIMFSVNSRIFHVLSPFLYKYTVSFEEL